MACTVAECTIYYIYIAIIRFILIRQKNSAAFVQKNKCFTLFGKIFVNFYDIFFMRYTASYVCLFLANMIIYYMYKDTSSSSSILYICFILLFAFYIISVYSHLNTYFVIIQISNESISRDKGKYIFDIMFSRQFDNILLILKLLVAIEYNYTIIKNKI